MTTERRRNAPGKTSDLLQKGQTKKKGRSLNYEKQKILGSTDGRADGTGYGSLTDWMYTPETEDELTKLLVSIDEVSYGSAGASLQQANAAVAVMKLAMDESGKAQETVKAYLEGMNETQKDYFSFQWQQAMKTALALLNGDEDAAILEDAGDADFDLKAVDSKKVAEFNDAVIALLGDAGVTNEWKNHTDVEPFLYATAIK